MRANDDSTSTDTKTAAAGFLSPALGAVIGERYRIVRAIGSGGMGAVFEAEHVALRRRCAIKFLRSELAGQSRSAERFRREARLLGRLEHDHLATVIDEGVLHGRFPFLVMEFLEGSTLRDWLIERGPLPTGMAIDIFLQAARGMAYVHARGVVHRDLKPSNMMLTTRSDGRVWLKILDFGIAREINEAEGLLTPSGVELGTAHYMSPEQARGAKDVDARSDVYALGCIIYEALTGQRAHGGESYNAVIFHLFTQAPRPLAELVPDCPDDLVAIVERCLEKDPARRYPNAKALAGALVARQANSPDDARNADVTGLSSSARRRSKTSWFAVGVAVGGVVMASVGALGAMDGRIGQKQVAQTLQSGARALATATDKDEKLESVTPSSDTLPAPVLHAALSEPDALIRGAAPMTGDVPAAEEVRHRSSLQAASPEHRPRRLVPQAEHAEVLALRSETVGVASKRDDSTSLEAKGAASLLTVKPPAEAAATKPSLRLVTTNPYDISP